MKDIITKWLIGVVLAGVLTGVLTLLSLYVRYTITDQVDIQLSARGLPSTSQIELMGKDIKANEERIGELKRAADKIDSKVERIVDILLEE